MSSFTPLTEAQEVEVTESRVAIDQHLTETSKTSFLGSHDRAILSPGDLKYARRYVSTLEFFEFWRVA